MKQILKKYDNLIMLFVMIALSSSFLLAVPLDANDELWNFSNVYKMVNGMQIYKELNVIITPLFFFFGKIMLQVFGDNYLIFRIYSVVIINTCVFYLVYQIFKTMKVQKINAIFFTIFFMIVQMIILLNGFYNFLAILFVLLGILWELKIKENKKYKSIIQGVFIFLVFLTKQNIGALYLLSRIVYVFIKEGKKHIKNLCIELGSSAVSLVLFLLYMYVTNNLYAFLDYTIGGLKEFSHNNVFGSTVGLLVIVLEIGISIFVIWMAKNKKIPLEKQDRNCMLLLATTSLLMLGIAYPIFNTAHVFIGSMVFITMMIYVIDLLIFKPFFSTEKANKIKKWLVVVVIVVLIGGNVWYSIYQYYQLKPFLFARETPYYGVLVEKDKKEEIEEIVQYTLQEEKMGKKVVILSYYANLYMNLLGRNNGEMDLPFYGNLGRDGEDGLVEQIKQLKNTKILILTNEDKYYQESQKVMNYVKENYPKEGEIRQFSIYNVE